MKPEYSAAIFHVGNVDTSIKYYTEILGFTVDFRYRDLAGLEYNAVLIYLSGPNQNMKKAVGIYIFCNKVEQYYESILSKGALL